MAVLAIGTAVVLTVASVVSQLGAVSAGTHRRTAASWVVLATPEAEAAQQTGRELVSTLTGSAGASRSGLLAMVAGLVRDAAAEERAIEATGPPWPSGASACVAAATDRTRVAAVLQADVSAALGGRFGTAPVHEASLLEGLDAAGRALGSADAAWSSCRAALRRATRSVELPEVRWRSDAALWHRDALRADLRRWQDAPGLAATHRISVVSVGVDPVPVGTSGSVAVLPSVGAISVRVVVADQGTVAERGVMVSVRWQGSAGGAPVVVTRSTGALSPGGSVALGRIRVPLPAGTTSGTIVAEARTTTADVSSAPITFQIAGGVPAGPGGGAG